MTPWWWSLLLAAVGVTGIWLAGRKSWTGWALGLAAQLLWVAYALVSHQYGFLLSAAAYGWVYSTNLYRWLREARTTPADPLPEVELRPPTTLRSNGTRWTVTETSLTLGDTHTLTVTLAPTADLERRAGMTR